MELAVPSDRRYSDADLWAKEEGGLIRIGITDFAQDQLGEIVYVDLPELKAEVQGGVSLGQVESTKTFSDLLAPVSGTVHIRHDALVDDPSPMNYDPYGAGWILVIQPSSRQELDHLMSNSQYRNARSL